MRTGAIVAATCIVAIGAAAAVLVRPEAAAEEAERVEFTEAFLTDDAAIEAGEEIWEDQCQHCHGSSAYPGKAPKLKPKKYTPEFVYDRVTNGFRKMPAWKDVYTKDERMSVTAYILSDDFSP